MALKRCHYLVLLVHHLQNAPEVATTAHQTILLLEAVMAVIVTIMALPEIGTVALEVVVLLPSDSDAKVGMPWTKVRFNFFSVFFILNTTFR